MAGDSEQQAGDGTGNRAENERQRKASRQKLEQWLNKSMRIRMTDGRTLIGTFLCTDCDCNIIMGSCEEYLKPADSEPRENPRILGLAMIPGKHVKSIEIDETSLVEEEDSGNCMTRNNSNATASSGQQSDTSLSSHR